MFFVFMLRNKERQFYLWKSMNKKKKDRILIFLKRDIKNAHTGTVSATSKYFSLKPAANF